MATSLKAPPVFVEDEDYLSWKNDVNVWQMFTDIKKEKQGPAVYLTLTGRARDAVRELKLEDIGSATGVKQIIDKLDTLYLGDVNSRAYLSFKEFYDYKRGSGDKYQDFIV